MHTRRRLLAGFGAATTAGLAGCLGLGDDDSGGTDDDEEFFGEAGPETDDEFLNSLANPAHQIRPKFFAAYQYTISELHDSIDVIDALPAVSGVLATDVAELIAEGIEGVSLSDVETLTGSTYRQEGVYGTIDIRVPNGEAIQVSGQFDREPLVSFFQDNALFSSIGADSGFDRFVRVRDEIEEFRAFAIDDGRLIFSRRTDIDVAPEDALGIEIDQVDSSRAPIYNGSRGLYDAVEAQDSGPIRGGVGHAFVPLAAATGTSAFDLVVNGLVGAGLSVSPGTNTEIHRTVSYLEADMASASRQRDAYEASELDSIDAAEWSHSESERTVSARATVDGVPDRTAYHTSLPVTGYDTMYVPTSPANLGRDPPPRVFLQPTVDDGILRLEHVGGDAVSDLEIRYVHDGDSITEAWEGTIETGDVFTTADTLDSGTLAWIIWEPGTENATVLDWYALN